MSGRPIVLDANLLVLFVVGATSRIYIEKHKRLRAFVPEAFDLLNELITQAPAVLVTPNTWTEACNLASQIAEPARSKVRETLRRLVAATDETYVESRTATEAAEYMRLGLADAALIVGMPNEAKVLTVDLDLYLALLRRGRRATNFNHLLEQLL